MARGLGECLTLIDHSDLRFYVYVLIRPSGHPFYVGKGTGARIARHEQDAINTKMRGYRLSIIRACHRDKLKVGYELAGFFRKEADAFAEEKRLIALYGRFDSGRGPLTNNTDGGEGAVNPSAATIEKRRVGLKAVMLNPEYKARAVGFLRASEPKRMERAIAATKTEAYRAANSKRSGERWADPLFREKTTVAIRAAQNETWKERHAAGIARVQSDPSFHQRRNDAQAKAFANRPKADKPRAKVDIAVLRASQSATAKIRCQDPAWRQRLADAGKRGRETRWGAK